MVVGNGPSTSSPDNTGNDSSGGSSGTLAYIGIALFVGIALFIALFYITRLITNRQERLQIPLTSPRISPANAHRSRNLGLDLEDISLLPTFPYQPIKRSCNNKGHEHKVSTVECAVCLGELEEGDMVRVLPACKHYFHVKCIDMWLSTRSSCPMCRAHPEPEKVKSGLVPISPPWRHMIHSCSFERQQFSFGSCLSSPFVKTPRNKSPSPLGTSPFRGSWQGSPTMMATPPRDLQLLPAEARILEIY